LPVQSDKAPLSPVRMCIMISYGCFFSRCIQSMWLRQL